MEKIAAILSNNDDTLLETDDSEFVPKTNCLSCKRTIFSVMSLKSEKCSSPVRQLKILAAFFSKMADQPDVQCPASVTSVSSATTFSAFLTPF